MSDKEWFAGMKLGEKPPIIRARGSGSGVAVTETRQRRAIRTRLSGYVLHDMAKIRNDRRMKGRLALG